MRIGIVLALLVAVVVALAPHGGDALVGTAHAQQPGTPGDTLGALSDTDIWRNIRQGVEGSVSIPDKQAGVLVQSEGDNWRAFRNGPLSVYGAWALGAGIVVVALFFVLRGRVRIEAGWSDILVVRFNGIERFGHWLTAVTFMILAITGLNMLYGRYVLLPVVGPEVFAFLTQWGKYLHNYVAFAFMVGLVLIFVLWIKDNFPNRYDFVWLIRAGGLFTKHSHPPSKKFNAGQKLIFWFVIISGLSLSLSGLMLIFPFQFAFFDDTFVLLNKLGLDLPTGFTPMQEMQLAQLWHSVMAIALIVIVIAHIYIGSLGMEGAFSAMGSGEVDLNWAREHHSIWVAKLEGRAEPLGDDY